MKSCWSGEGREGREGRDVVLWLFDEMRDARCGVNYKKWKNTMNTKALKIFSEFPVVQEFMKFISTVIDFEGTFVFVLCDRLILSVVGGRREG